MQARIRKLVDEQELLRDTVRRGQEAAQSARERIGFLEAEARDHHRAATEAAAEHATAVSLLKAALEEAREEGRDGISHHKGLHATELARHEETRAEAERHRSALERTEHNLRFEQDMRAERERDVRDREQRVVEHQVSAGMLQQRLGEANGRYERERDTVKALEATLRLKEREVERELAARGNSARANEETLRVQLRAATELAEARRERSAHDEAAAVAAREALVECRAQKAALEEALALAQNASAKEKLELDERLRVAVEARRVTEASEHATAAQLAAAEARERELREEVTAKEAVNGELEHRVHVANAVAAEQNQARSQAERDADDYRARLDTLIDASTRSLASPISPPLLSPASPMASPATPGKIGYGSPGPRTTPLTPMSASSKPSFAAAPAVAAYAPEAAAEKASLAKAIVSAVVFVLAFAVIMNRYVPVISFLFYFPS